LRRSWYFYNLNRFDNFIASKNILSAVQFSAAWYFFLFVLLSWSGLCRSKESTRASAYVETFIGKLQDYRSSLQSKLNLFSNLCQNLYHTPRVHVTRVFTLELAQYSYQMSTKRFSCWCTPPSCRMRLSCPAITAGLTYSNDQPGDLPFLLTFSLSNKWNKNSCIF